MLSMFSTLSSRTPPNISGVPLERSEIIETALAKSIEKRSLRVSRFAQWKRELSMLMKLSARALNTPGSLGENIENHVCFCSVAESSLYFKNSRWEYQDLFTRVLVALDNLGALTLDFWRKMSKKRCNLPLFYSLHADNTKRYTMAASTTTTVEYTESITYSIRTIKSRHGSRSSVEGGKIMTSPIIWPLVTSVSHFSKWSYCAKHDAVCS